MREAKAKSGVAVDVLRRVPDAGSFYRSQLQELQANYTSLSKELDIPRGMDARQ